MPSRIYKMRIQIAILALILIDIFLVVYSCQHRSHMNPIEGSLTPSPPNLSDQVYDSPIYVTEDADGDGNIDAGIGSMGAYYAFIDTRNLAGELTPLRSNQAVGDDHIVDITAYLNGSPCGDCFKMESVGLNNLGELEVEFSMRHPFPLPQNNPPGYRDRLDLSVFDVEAIFFFSDRGNAVSFPTIAETVLGPTGGATIMEADNSGFWASEDWDGFTDHFDDYVDGFFDTSTNLHPYKMFFEGNSTGNFNPGTVNGFTDLYNQSGYNVFPQGGGPDYQTVNFGINPDSEIGFVVLLSAAYGQSARFWGSDPGQRGNPRYFLPEFNRKEPWKVEISIPEDTDLLAAGDPISSTVLNINVYDWQHSLGNVTGTYDPYTAPLNSLKRSSKVQGVMVEIPGVNPLVQVNNPKTGTGVGSNPLQYVVTVPNALGASEGRYSGLVAVVDELHGTYLGGYGVERDGVTVFDMNRFAAYAMFQVNVIDRGGGSFSVGYSMYGGDEGGSGTDKGNGVSLDSMIAQNIAVQDNNVYIVGSILNGPGGDSWDVYLMRSTNGGMSFEKPRILNQDYVIGNIGIQNQPCISVAPDTGYVYVMFTDKSLNRDSVEGDTVIIRRSKDKGVTFSSPGTKINTYYGSVDSGVIEAGTGGRVWAAFRHEYEYPMDLSRLVLFTSQNYGDSYTLGFIDSSTPENHSFPMILSQKNGITDPGIVALVWRQQSLYEPDLRFAVTYDGGNTFMYPQKISADGYNQYASFPRAEMDSNGNIYCMYRLNTLYEMPSTLKLTVGHRNGYNYLWESKDIQKAPDMLFGDLDICLADDQTMFLCWNQLDNANTMHGQDIYVYKGAVQNLIFEEYAHIKEPTDFFADQDMPRFTADSKGEIYMVYRDNSYIDGGELFFTHGYQ